MVKFWNIGLLKKGFKKRGKEKGEVEEGKGRASGRKERKERDGRSRNEAEKGKGRETCRHSYRILMFLTIVFMLMTVAQM